MRTPLQLAVIAGVIAGVLVFWGGLRVGVALQGRDAAVTLHAVGLLNDLVGRSQCVWYMPNDSLRPHPYHATADPATQ